MSISEEILSSAGHARQAAPVETSNIIATGGNSILYSLPDSDLSYKKFRFGRVGDELEELVSWFREAGKERQEYLLDNYAWPLSVVVDPAGDTVGVLQPKVPLRFRTDVSTSQRQRVRNLSYAMYPKRAERVGVQPPSNLNRLQIGLSLVRSLRFLETEGFLHTDLSASNILWSAEQNDAEVYLLDCDSLVRDETLLDPTLVSVTPDWADTRILRGEISQPDYQSLSYCIGLVVIRLTLNPEWSPLNGAAPSEADFPNWVPSATRQLAVLSVAALAESRPRLSDWENALSADILSLGKNEAAIRPRVRDVRAGVVLGGQSWDSRLRLATLYGVATGIFLSALVLVLLITALNR